MLASESTLPNDKFAVVPVNVNERHARVEAVRVTKASPSIHIVPGSVVGEDKEVARNRNRGA